jgi:hypothetical protein
MTALASAVGVAVPGVCVSAGWVVPGPATAVSVTVTPAAGAVVEGVAVKRADAVAPGRNVAVLVGVGLVVGVGVKVGAKIVGLAVPVGETTTEPLVYTCGLRKTTGWTTPSESTR